jgi:hypothetical protein
MAKKKQEKPQTKADGSVKPTRVSQVNSFLRQHGLKDVTLERGHGYFTFWGMPIDRWLNRVVLVEGLDELTLDQWLEKYRELEKQNATGSFLPKGKPKKRK